MYLLGRFFAYGPSFDKARRHCTPISIRELCLDVVEKDERERHLSVCGQLSFFLGWVARNGVLSGKFDKISFHVAGTLSKEWEVIKDTGPSATAATVKEWSDYGWIPQ